MHFLRSNKQINSVPQDTELSLLYFGWTEAGYFALHIYRTDTLQKVYKKLFII